MKKIVAALALATATSAYALDVSMQSVAADGKTAPIGSISLTQTQYGVVLTPALHDLPPGTHGFHLHEKASCDPGKKDGKTAAAIGAGGHFDPAHTGHHEGPYAAGHLGDLPALFVNADGTASQPLLAPRLKLSDFPGHALVIHAGGDNNADQPAALGGGGARIACGTIGSP
jgi:Cu-Zn family superoxide dismutase